jgi:hypothetical protein
MSDIDVLSARLEVKDSFTSQLNSFIKTTENADKTFEKFINNADMSSRILEKTLDVIKKKVNSITTVIKAQTDITTNKILNSANKIEQAQVKAVGSIENKYKNMSKDVQDIFKVINKDAETLAKSSIKINIGGGSSSKKKTKDNKDDFFGGVFSDNKAESSLGGILSGNLSKVLGGLSIIGAGITGVKKILDTINGWSQQGFNAINALSGNLLSYQGLKEGLKTAGQFETNRVAMDVLYGNNPAIGQKYYAMGTKLAKETPYSESSVGELQKKLAGSHVNYKEKDLMTLLDIASIKPELGAEHVGFSVVK